MTGQDDRFKHALDQGHSAAWDQDWVRAASYYRQALDEKPDNLTALTSLGLALHEMRDFREALKYYARAAELSEDDPVPHEKKAVIFDQLGQKTPAAAASIQAAELYLERRDVSKAIENWTRAVIINPENKRAHARLAIVYERLGQKDKAISEYINVASLFQHEEKQDQAMQALQRALDLSPGNLQVRKAIKTLQDGKKLPKPARPSGGTGPLEEKGETLPQIDTSADGERDAAFRSPVEQSRSLALSILAKVVFEDHGPGDQDRSDISLSDLMEGESGDPAGDEDQTRVLMHVSQAIEFQTGGEQMRAVEELKRAVDAGLNHPAAHFNLGYLYMETGRLESAQRSLHKATIHQDYALAAHLLLAQIYRYKQEWQEAAGSYLEALKVADSSLIQADDVDHLHGLYDPLIDAQSKEQDEEALQKLCDNISNLLMRPNWKEHLEDVREQFGGEMGEGELIPLADYLLETHGNQIMDMLTKIQNRARQGKYGAAMEKAFFALELAPTYLPLHIVIGDLLYKRDQVQAAVAKYSAVADVYSVQGKVDRAIAMLERVIDLVPMNIDVRRRMIALLENNARVDQAVEEYINLGEVYYSLAELSNSRQAYQNAFQLVQKKGGDEKWRARIMHRLADIDTQRLDWDSALAIYEDICSNRPGDEKAWLSTVDLYYRLENDQQANDHIYSYLEYLKESGHAEKRIPFLKKLQEETSRKIEPRMMLADIYAEEGKIDAAIAELDSLGESFMQQGRELEAIEVIRKIVTLNPPNAAQYQKLLDQLDEKYIR